jgi:ankyrin repeat protein
VELLLANRADVNAKNNDGWTPLYTAAETGHKDVVELLLANRADVNAKDNGSRTPLHAAAESGHKDVVELLLANGAEVNAKANNGWTPLKEAADEAAWASAYEGRYRDLDDVVQLLRQHGGHE